MRAVPVALLAALLVATLVLAGCSGSDGSSGASGSSPAVPGPAITDLDTGAVGVADVDGGAWTVLYQDGSVRTPDDDRIHVGHAPLRIVDTPAGVWVSVIRDGTVVRLDPASGTVDKTIRLTPHGSEPEGLSWDGTSLWVVDQAHARVLRLSPDGRVLGSVRVGEEPRLVTSGPSGTWVTSYGGTSVTRVSGHDPRTVPLTGCVGPQGIAEAAGRVWVSCTLSDTVVALDAHTLRQVAAAPDLPSPDALVAHGDTVYVVGQAGPTVWVVDARTGKVEDTVALDDEPRTNENVGAAVVGADLVVTHPEARRIYSLPLP